MALSILLNNKNALEKGRHDIQHNDTQHKRLIQDTQHNDIQHYDTQYKGLINDRSITTHTIRKDCFQNKSKFITEDHFTKYMNITIR
jgi:hypothetical protein